ncbi:MAG: S8 family serine peptidase [Candidatus Cybelea sp.]
MKSQIRFFLPMLAVLAAAACSTGGTSNVPSSPSQSSVSTGSMPQWQAKHLAHRACPDAPLGYMHCDVLIESKTGAGPNVEGLTPANFEARYNLPSTKDGAGQVVAIVDAFDNPNAATDLAAYRTEFGLGKANFTKYNQLGQTKNYPQGSSGWGVEEDLDIEMVSASCPKCTIYLIESDDNSGTNLYDAEIEAVKLGAGIVSNSWGGGAGSSSGGAFATKGITYLASAGDGGYGMQDPADYQTVVSVGGTFLNVSSGSKFIETVWPDSGGGCSVVNKPSWQHDKGCTLRTGNDVSAVAWNAAEYDTYGNSGWFTVGGTSVSSPLVAGIFALAGNSKSEYGGEKLWKLKKDELRKDFHYIKDGELGGCPTSLQGTYLCDAGTKQFGQYSGPSGWGTPNGIAGL